ncbi:unnamed protein product [Paramecium primaurelia]|uniref:Uncharacterized protein n=1 Tax=Paramecium primaurelia TaxID=5886 RepID=A0A8S1JMN8_PARPR|nr:unnamed protein product [Paramecium primaurelia]
MSDHQDILLIYKFKELVKRRNNQVRSYKIMIYNKILYLENVKAKQQYLDKKLSNF